MAYTLRYQSELRNQLDCFRDIPDQKIDKGSLEMAETLIDKLAGKLRLGEFEDGYEVTVKELVDTKLKHPPVPKEEELRVPKGKVVNLMDALRKSVNAQSKSAGTPLKKTVASTKEPAPRKGLSLVNAPAKSAKRKSARADGRRFSYTRHSQAIQRQPKKSRIEIRL